MDFFASVSHLIFPMLENPLFGVTILILSLTLNVLLFWGVVQSRHRPTSHEEHRGPSPGLAFAPSSHPDPTLRPNPAPQADPAPRHDSIPQPEPAPQADSVSQPDVAARLDPTPPAPQGGKSRYTFACVKVRDRYQWTIRHECTVRGEECGQEHVYDFRSRGPTYVNPAPYKCSKCGEIVAPARLSMQGSQ